MKTQVSFLGFVFLLVSGAPAWAQSAAPATAPKPQTALKIELQIQPVANQAELMQLMRRNSVRVALQRHQLWQQAVALEEQQDRAGEQPRHRHRYRHRNRVRKVTMGTSTPAMAPKAVDAVPVRPTMAAASMGRPAPRAVARPTAPANLRQLLRQGRAGDALRLERKLQARIREQRRQRERLRHRGQGGAAKGHRRGGRSGR